MGDFVRRYHWQRETIELLELPVDTRGLNTLNVCTALLVLTRRVLQCKPLFAIPSGDPRTVQRLRCRLRCQLYTPLLHLRISSHRLHTPSPPLGHAPSHVTVAATAAIVIVIAIATATATIEAPHNNAFSPWDSNDALAEVLGVQESLATLWRMVWAVTAIATSGRKGWARSPGQQGPHMTLYRRFSLFYPCSTNYSPMI